MINISESYIDSLAPNESAVKNAWGLVKKKNFVKLCKSEDDTLLFGECMGSGSSNYICSADFIKPESPVFRCTCPSRQIPCKHTLGLLYAFISGNEFETSEIPDDIKEKREKAEKKEAKKKEDTGEKAPKKVNKSALEKKIKMQIEGIDLLEKMVKDTVKLGFAAIDTKTLNMLEEQAKNLNSSYLPGAQRALREFILLFRGNENREKIYLEAADQISTIYTLCKKGREYLGKRLEHPELAMDTTSSIDEWLGHAWQLDELESEGLYEENAELIQLSFDCYIDEARMEYIDLGLWIDLNTGEISETCNYRPFRAAKYIKEEDSFFLAAKVNKLYKYPGDINKRVRWEEMTTREIEKADYIKIKSFAKRSYIDVIKAVKNQIKNPLSDKYPVMLLNYKTLGMVGDDFVTEDEVGKRICLFDRSQNNDDSRLGMLRLLSPEQLKNQAVLARFEHDMENGKLTAKPLSIITDNEIIRLFF